MALKTSAPSSPNSASTDSDTAAATPTALPGANIAEQYRTTTEGKALVDWVKSEWSKAKAARNKKQLQWFVNMAMFYGQQWVEKTTGLMPRSEQNKLVNPKKPYYAQKRIINRSRSFVRWELAKLLSNDPNASAVPASSEDQDIRAAYAAEQVWQSYHDGRKFRSHFARAAWWQVVTGNGFIKTEWDPDCIDKASGQPGDIKYSCVTPFHLFVPDLREQDIEDQPYLINAYTRPVEWVKARFHEELGEHVLAPSTSAANEILDDSYLNVGNDKPLDSVVVYETWIKPGSHKSFPEGAVVITVDDYLLRLYEGWPYKHGQYPFTKFEHIPTSTFYADSPLVDLNNLQREYNQIRSEIADAGRRMARPQLLVAKGSLVPNKITNEPGLIIEYKPGFAPPTPIPLSQLPQYYLDQQDRILADWEEISGTRDVTTGQAPAGVTAGTAINYLQEAANQFLTPQYQSIEMGHERIAAQTIELFVQYVDVARKVRVVGADGAFDAQMLSGEDITGGTDIRIEPGSSMGRSKAAQQAQIMDLFSTGVITDPTMALRLMEMGGVQKIQDTLAVAEKKAQRENMKMKLLKPQDLQAALAQHQQEVQAHLMQDPEAGQMMQDPAVLQELQNLPAPMLVPVDDFDVHDIHLDVHNRFRMGQEYEMLPPEVKDQFAQHVAAHQMALQQQQMPAVDPATGQPLDPEQAGAAPGGPASPDSAQGGPSMSANGAVPAPQITGG
jgi:hypothetical protein